MKGISGPGTMIDLQVLHFSGPFYQIANILFFYDAQRFEALSSTFALKKELGSYLEHGNLMKSENIEKD